MANFPPAATPTLTKTLPSYLYQQYADDQDLQAFVDSFNAQAQQFVDWFVQIGLPVYTGPMIVGALLDWVGTGLYGLARPTLSSGVNQNIGAFNTVLFRTLPLDGRKVTGASNVAATSDDVYKRILTWHLYKGDGKQFNIKWLKRRIMRFLTGLNGADGPFDNTNQVSVSFGVDGQVSIRILSGVRKLTGGAVPGRFQLNTVAPDGATTSFVAMPSQPLAAVLQQAIASDAIELPFISLANPVVTIV